MEVYLLPAAIAIVFGVFALGLARFSSDRRPLQSRISLAVAALALPAGLVFGLLGIFVPPPPAGSGPPGPQWKLAALNPGDYPAGPLAAGDKLPPFDAGGWLNNHPPVPVTGGQLLTVVDLWSLWHPSHSAAAPGLVETYHKYKDRRVAFVSVTDMPRQGVEAFAERFAIPWPCGYEAKSETLASFGAFDFNKHQRGYELILTIYVVDARGRVVWNDGRARMKSMNADGLIRQLDDQISQALAAAEAAETKQSPP